MRHQELRQIRSSEVMENDPQGNIIKKKQTIIEGKGDMPGLINEQSKIIAPYLDGLPPPNLQKQLSLIKREHSSIQIDIGRITISHNKDGSLRNNKKRDKLVEKTKQL